LSKRKVATVAVAAAVAAACIYLSCVIVPAVRVNSLIRDLRSSNPGTRSQAINALSAYKSDYAIGRLIRTAADRRQDWPTRNAAADALEKIGPPAIEPIFRAAFYECPAWVAYIPWFRTTDDTAQSIEFRLLGRRFSPAESVILARLTSDRDRNVRMGTIRVLGENGDPDTALQALAPLVSDTDDDVRKAAVEALGATRKPAAVPLLLPALEDPNETIREQAVWSLRRLRVPSAVDAIIPLLRDPSVEVRSVAADTLGGFCDPRAVEPLIETCRDQDQWVRVDAVRALGLIGGERALEALIDMAADAKSELGEIASALGYTRDSRAVEPLAHLLVNDDAQVRVNAAEALGWIARTGDKHMVAPLVTALLDNDWSVRTAAAESLGLTKDPAAVEPLMTLVETSGPRPGQTRLPSYDVLYSGGPSSTPADASIVEDARVNAAEALGEIRDQSALEPLLAALDDASASVAAAAAHALGKLKNPRALEPLLTALDHESIDVATAAARALGDLGDPAAGPALLALLPEGGKFAAIPAGGPPRENYLSDVVCLRATAAKSLGRIKAPNVFDALAASLADESCDLRAAAAEGLAALQDPRAVDPLAKAFARETDDWARSEIAFALEVLKAPQARAAVVQVTDNVDLDEVAANYAAHIRAAEPRDAFNFPFALERAGTYEMAESLYWCGVDHLRSAAKDWAFRHDCLDRLESSTWSPDRPRWGRPR